MQMLATSDIGEIQSQFFTYGSPEAPIQLQLNNGQLPSVTLAYETYGSLNEEGTNAVLVFHALSGTHHAAGYNRGVEGVERLWTDVCKNGWWDAFIGPNKALNTDKYFIICANYLGGCYGSTGPSSLDPTTGKPYGGGFPAITISDIVRSQVRLLDHLGIQKLHAVTGGSVGGMLCMCLATLFPDRVERVLPIATNLEVTLLQRIHNMEQICAIQQDPNFCGGDYYDGAAPDCGLALARMIAHKTYVSLATLADRASNEVIVSKENCSQHSFSHPVESYLHHHGQKFTKRFDANTYLRIMEAWQHMDLLTAAGVSTYDELFSACAHQRYMIFSIDSDVSFYPDEQRQIARRLKSVGIPCRHITVHSENGHDAFLLEPELFTPHFVFTLEGRW